MTTNKTIRVRVITPHLPTCAKRIKAAKWQSAWWLDGSTEYLSRSGRAMKQSRDLWLVARCIFGDHYGRKFDGACQAKAVVHAMDVGDALTNRRQLSMSGKNPRAGRK